MPADIRINDITTDVNMVDTAGLLTPEVLERVVQAVLKRLEEQQRSEHEVAQERTFGAARRRTNGG